MSKTWIYLRLLQILLDVCGILGAFMLAYFLRVGWIFSTDFPFHLYALVALFSTLIWMGFLMLAKYYRVPPRSGSRVSFDIILIFLGGAIATGVMIVSYFFPREILFSRLISVYSFSFGTLWLVLTQLLTRQLLKGFKRQERHIYRTLVVGANRTAERLIHAIENNAYAPHKIIGVIDPYGLSSQIKGSQILGKLNKLETLCEEENITALIQCDAFEHTINLISLCDEKNIKFQFDPSLRGIFEENLRIREIAGIPMISFVQREFSGVKKLRFRFIDSLLRQVFDVD